MRKKYVLYRDKEKTIVYGYGDISKTALQEVCQILNNKLIHDSKKHYIIKTVNMK